jgi:hypothetical protein
VARRFLRDDSRLVAVRAAYAALLLGLVGGVLLATGVLSSGPSPPAATVADVLGLDVPGSDIERRRGEAVAVLVARCMTRNGFAWTPWVEPSPTVPDADLGPIPWAERWGFGISTVPRRPQPVEPGDPNMATLVRLPPDERDALHRALYGDRAGPGCQAVATDEVYGLRERSIAQLRPALDALDARIAADPDAETLVSTWRTCVVPVTHGMPTIQRGELPARVMAGISGRLAGLGRTPAAVAGLAALQAEERRAATVLARCETAFSAGRSVVAAPYEAAFTLEHGDALRRIGAEVRAAEAALPTAPP